MGIEDWGPGQGRLSRRRFIGAGLAAALSAATFGRPNSSGADTLPQAGGPSTPRILALTGATLYPAPDVPSIARGVVVLKDKTIQAVGTPEDVSIPADAQILDCTGLTVMAGFWNCHVHFSRWQGADTLPALQLGRALSAMLTRYGFVRVVDTGSRLSNTRYLRRRIASGEVSGPLILTAGSGFAPSGGSPYYIQPARVPELIDSTGAATLVDQNLDEGAEVIKLYSGSWSSPDSMVLMPPDVIRAATKTAHDRGALVLAHPSNSAGAKAAIDGGVDILAHTFPSPSSGPWDRSLAAQMTGEGVGLIPTLKLWSYEVRRLSLPSLVGDRARENAAAQVSAFADCRGQLLFGTDVGYMSDFYPTDEYVLMKQAGLSFEQILAALTTGPAARFGRAAHSGRVVVGMDAELVVVEGSPKRDIAALARVRYVVREGRIVFDGK